MTNKKETGGKANMSKVIFAEDAATVHVLIGPAETLADGTLHEPYESKVLLPGETLALSDVPSYLREAVEKGEAPGLTLLTPAAAKKLVEKADRIRNKEITTKDFLEESDELESE